MISPRNTSPARTLTGDSSDGKLEGVSPEWREVADWLAAMPLEDRLDGWMAFLDSRDDREEIIRAVADIDPTGPLPEASEAADAEEPPQERWITLEPGTVLLCCDRSDEPPNYGKVVQDLGEWCLMIFREEEEGETRVKIHKRNMRLPRWPAPSDPCRGICPYRDRFACATLADVRTARVRYPVALAGVARLRRPERAGRRPRHGEDDPGVLSGPRLWFRRHWPDGEANPFPEGTRTLWVPGTATTPQLLDLAEHTVCPTRP